MRAADLELGAEGRRARPGREEPMNRRSIAIALAAVALGLSAATARSDAKGEALLRGAMKKLQAARTYSADLVSTTTGPGRPEMKRTGSILAMKPNYLRVELKAPAPAGTVVYAADGKSYTTYFERAKRYQRGDLAAAPQEFPGEWEAEVDAFFGGDKNVPKSGAEHVGTETVGATACELVKVVPGEGRHLVYAIGKDDGLIHQTRMVFATQDGEVVNTNTLTNIKLNAERKPTEFAFSPPADARLIERPNFEASLLAVGKPAPDFQLPQPGGTPLTLENTLKGKKAVLVNFWFYN
jgi:outer membrane lipoprotein-sorting protein